MHNTKGGMSATTVDSCACDSVMPTALCSTIPVIEFVLQRTKVQHDVATWQTVKNEGERRCLRMTPGAAQARNITFQISGVHKPLLRITRAADAGFECHLAHMVWYLLGCRSGHRVPNAREGDLYASKAWVEGDESGTTEGCHRQGQRLRLSTPRRNKEPLSPNIEWQAFGASNGSAVDGCDDGKEGSASLDAMDDRGRTGLNDCAISDREDGKQGGCDSKHTLVT